MNQQFELLVRLFIQGPFMTGIGADAARGLDSIFSRDNRGCLVLNASHIKGKLREATNELVALGGIDQFDPNHYFGKENDKSSFEAEPGQLRIEDFQLAPDAPISTNSQLTRIAIDPRTHTAKEAALQSIENLFPSGRSSEWIGKIEFFAPGATEAALLSDKLLMAFKWMTALGAHKGNGYGRLDRVKIKLNQVENKSPVISLETRSETIGLTFEFLDDLFIGGIGKGANFKASETVIPGSVLKGALARFLNMLCGADAMTLPIDTRNTEVAREFPLLANHFSKIRFSHAFPRAANSTGRPVAIPFSTISDSTGKIFHDLALISKEDYIQSILNHYNEAPCFAIDWKDDSSIKNQFGWAECPIIHKTRTAIHPQLRAADENRLYTFQYIRPFKKSKAASGTDIDEDRIPWVANIRLPKMDAQDKLGRELLSAISYGWQFLGKRNSRFRLKIAVKPPAPSMPKYSGQNLIGDHAVIVLQTDALLFDGQTLSQEKSIIIEKIYQKYWAEQSGELFELKRFFARQKMWGGYLVKRYLPDQPYYPYILTSAGSVFVLELIRKDRKDEALTLLENWEKHGLPLPPAIFAEPVERDQQWNYCPFVPENGFGEISINLNWHWNHKLTT